MNRDCRAVDKGVSGFAHRPLLGRGRGEARRGEGGTNGPGAAASFSHALPPEPRVRGQALEAERLDAERETISRMLELCEATAVELAELDDPEVLPLLAEVQAVALALQARLRALAAADA